jgi:hypothetical protein
VTGPAFGVDDDAEQIGASQQQDGGWNTTKSFEAVQRAMALDSGLATHNEGVSAVDGVLQLVKASVTRAAQTMFVSSVTMNALGGLMESFSGEKLERHHSRNAAWGQTAELQNQLLQAPPVMVEDDEDVDAHKSGIKWLDRRQEQGREMICKACFLRLRIHTQKYVTGKITLSEYYRFNMEALHKLVQSAVYHPFIRPLVRNSQYKKHTHAPSDENIEIPSTSSNLPSKSPDRPPLLAESTRPFSLGVISTSLSMDSSLKPNLVPRSASAKSPSNSAGYVDEAETKR